MDTACQEPKLHAISGRVLPIASLDYAYTLMEFIKFAPLQAARQC